MDGFYCDDWCHIFNDVMGSKVIRYNNAKNYIFSNWGWSTIFKKMSEHFGNNETYKRHPDSFF